MGTKLIALLVVATLIASTTCFTFTDVLNMTAKGFSRVASRFGEKIWHKNNTFGEETVLEDSEINVSPESYKAALDTILDITKNPQRQR